MSGSIKKEKIIPVLVVKEKPKLIDTARANIVNKSVTSHILEDKKSSKLNNYVLVNNDGWWFSKIFNRVNLTINFIAMPFVFLLTLFELVIAITMVSIIFTLVAWYFNMIPDQAVADALLSVGGRLLNILKLSGVF